jgi:terminase large subunit-like protein
MRPSVSVLAACGDPQLLAFPLWPRQRDLLADLETGPTLQVWALGRRSGKTTIGAAAGVCNALFRPDLDALVRPGERRYVVSIANTQRQARLFVRAALSLVENSPLLRGEVSSATLDEIVFANGVVLAAFPCTARGIRGWPVSFLFLDELAHFVDDTEGVGPQVADHVFRAATPSVAQFGELGRIVCSSTPWGSDGLFAELYRKATSGELEHALAQSATSAEMNPTLSADWLEQQRVILREEEFATEYLADFAAGGSAYFEEGAIDEAVSDRGEIPPETPGYRHFVAGLDPAFGGGDAFGVAIVCESMAEPGRLELAFARAWKPQRTRRPRTLEEARRVEDELLVEVADACRRYGARAVTDQHKAAGVVDRLHRLGVSCRTEAMTERSKTDVFRELRARLNAGELSLYPQPQLLVELRRVRSRFQANKASVFIPRVGGSHGDIAQALALAAWEHRGSRSDRSSGAGVEVMVDGQWIASSRRERSGRHSRAGYEEGVLDPSLKYGMEL